MDTNNIRCRWQDDVVTGECRFDCFDPVMSLSPLCEHVARDPRILDTLGSALRRAGVPVQGQADLSNHRERKGYSLRQDYIGWAIVSRVRSSR